MNDDGAEFRSTAIDLTGDVQYRKLGIVTPFFKDKLKVLTPNGIRNGDTVVLAFRGTDFPFTVENLVSLSTSFLLTMRGGAPSRARVVMRADGQGGGGGPVEQHIILCTCRFWAH